MTTTTSGSADLLESFEDDLTLLTSERNAIMFAKGLSMLLAIAVFWRYGNNINPENPQKNFCLTDHVHILLDSINQEIQVNVLLRRVF